MQTVFPTGATWLRRALGVSIIVHGLVVGVGWKFATPDGRSVELIDIEMAPPPPPAEALPPEVVRAMEEAAARQLAGQEPEPASTTPVGEGSIDAGVDAPVDAGIDAGVADARRRPDAALDAALDAAIDAPLDAAPLVATVDDGGSGPPSDAADVVVAGDGGTADAVEIAAAGSGSGSGAGGGSDTIAMGSGSAGSGSGSAGTANEPAVDGAPTTAGTAANLLSYFPVGHVVTALIRFDRLRGTEWAATTERLLRPMPDYQVLFGTTDARITDKLDTLVISSPAPRDATATTLVAHVSMGRTALREFLNAANPVAWSGAKGGLLGKRTGRVARGDKRVFLSPFKGWFLLGHPGDLTGLTAPAKGDLDAIESTVKLPPWLAGIRKIEDESGGEKRGPALVLTLAFDGKKIDLQGNDFGLGIGSVQMPTRVSLAMEIVKQGWLVRGNIKFATDAEATAFLAAVTTVKERIADSRALQMVVGKPVVHLVDALSFARTGARLSYATSLSIADARALLAVAAMQLDSYFVHP